MEWNALKAAAAAEGGALVSVTPFIEHGVGLVLTRLPGTKETVLDKTTTVLRNRLEALGSYLAADIRCDHTEDAVAGAIETLLEKGCAPVLVYGASAIVDRRDVVPAAIERVGGTVDHFGMPVDPGNLLLLGRRGPVPVVGLPGCARSPKVNGFDWVLQRLLAGLPVEPADIMRMGAGGLLKEIASRPQRREATGVGRGPRAPRIDAIILAAGQSRRMGRINKLLAEIDGTPMVARVVDAVRQSQVRNVVVVTGHEAERVRAVLKMAQQPISLQAPVGDSDDTSFGDFIEDKSAENPMEEAGFSMLKDKINEVLDTLTEREREVLEQRFGLKDGYSRTLEEVGRQFQVTRERIRQIEAKALRKMRHPTRIRKLEGFIELPNT